MNTNTNRNKHNKTDIIPNVKTDKTPPTNALCWLLVFKYFLKKLHTG